MNKTIALAFAAGTLLLVGCATTPHATKWEYKVVRAPSFTSQLKTGVPMSNEEGFNSIAQAQQAFLNNYGKEGWIYVKDQDGYYSFKRPAR